MPSIPASAVTAGSGTAGGIEGGAVEKIRKWFSAARADKSGSAEAQVDSGGDKRNAEKPKGADAASSARARRLLLAVVAALAGVLGGLLLFQSEQGYRVQRAMGQADDVSAIARDRLGELVRQQQRELAEALQDPEIARYFGRADAGDATRAAAALRQRLPDLEDVLFVDADVLGSIGADIASFGYARAEMLLGAARSGDAAPAQVHGGEGSQRSLMLVNPVRDGDRIVGFALAKMPYEPMRRLFQRLPDRGLGLSLLQGDARVGTHTLEGETRNLHRGGSVAIPGALLRVGYAPPEVRHWIGPEGAFANLLLGVCSTLLAALTVLWLRRPDLVLRLLPVAGKGTAQSEATLAEQLRAAAAAAPSAQDKPAPSVAVAEVNTPPVAGASEATKAASTTVAVAPSRPLGMVDRSIFRAYDIRGVVDKSLTLETAEQIGQAVGSEARARGLHTVLVGRDGRLSGPKLADAVIKGLLAAGCDVIDIGAVPTPLLYFATHDLNAGTGIMVTGSHNPPEYNGFKIMVGGETLAEDAIQSLYQRIITGRLERGQGALTQMDLGENYIDRISGDIQLESPLKVVLDAGNGIAGAIAPRLFEAIGAEVVPLYCDVDGNFPNHHPDPSDPHNLQDLIVSVKQLKADIGLAFDGDGDRLGVVTASGKIIYPDHLLMLFARDVLLRNPGATIIYDVKCTGHLAGVVVGHGGSPVMWKTGHSLIKKKMKATQAELAGEMSGHFFFQERWYGFDDGLYAGCRLLEIIASEGQSADELFAELPYGVSTPELKIVMAEGEHYRFMDRFRDRAKFSGARLTTIDGVRADWPDGWGLVRCSNTTPSLVLRFDADDANTLARVQQAFREQLLAVDPGLVMPF